MRVYLWRSTREVNGRFYFNKTETRRLEFVIQNAMVNPNSDVGDTDSGIVGGLFYSRR